MAQASVKSLLKEARKAIAVGDRQQAANIYFGILDKRPMNQEAINNAIECCEMLNDPQGLIRALTLKTKTSSNKADAWSELGRVQLEEIDNKNGLASLRTAIEIDKTHAVSLLRMAEYYCRYADFESSLKVFDQFLGFYSKDVLEPVLLACYLRARLMSMTADDDVAAVVKDHFDAIVSDFDTLHTILITVTNLCEHEVVNKLSEYANRNFPDRFVLPDLFLNWARSLSILGLKEETSRVFTLSRVKFDRYIEENAPPENYTEEDLCAILARIAQLAGLESDSYEQRALGNQTGANLLALEPVLMVHHLKVRSLWQEKFNNQDVCILLSGPSLGELEAKIEELRECENTQFIVLNFFTSVCEKLLSRIGRDPDAILMMSGIAFARQIDDVVDLLYGESAPFLITTVPLIGSQAESGKILAKLEQIFLLNSRTHVPGSISNCLSFENNNSLSSIIPILMTASPRRIFIFGADGGKSKSSDDVYFNGEQRPNQEENANINNAYLGLLEKEAEVCDNIMEFQVPWVSKLYNVEVPEIYNVCPTSNYSYFEKIDVDTAMTMLTSQADQWKSSRQDKMSTIDMKEIQQDDYPSSVQ